MQLALVLPEMFEDDCYECPDDFDGVGDCVEIVVEGCSPPTSINVQFSAYGSYNLVFLVVLKELKLKLERGYG